VQKDRGVLEIEQGYHPDRGLQVTARLHHITRTSHVSAGRCILVLHGILGSGANWAGFARDLVAIPGDHSVVAVDLRHHGRSESGDPPDTVGACVEDLLAWVAENGIEPSVVIGHSFGSKIALSLSSKLESVEQVIILDADPGPMMLDGIPRHQIPVLKLIDLLREAPHFYRSREQFAEVLARGGFRHGVAGWVGKNLHRSGDQLALSLDLDRIEAMLQDHHRFDSWDLIESTSCQRVSLVVGGRSTVVSRRSQQRFKGLHLRNPDRYRFEVIEDAGHWLHVDAPERLLELIGTDLLR